MRKKIVSCMLIVGLVVTQLCGITFANGTKNFALGKTVLASVKNTDTTVLVDGNTKSTDMKQTCLVKNGYSFTVDLGEPTEINMLNLYEFNYYESRRLNGYKLEGSADGQNWTVLSETDNHVIVCPSDVDKKNFLGSIVFQKTKVQYVRITLKSVIDVRNPANAAYGYLSEIEIYYDSNAVIQNNSVTTQASTVTNTTHAGDGSNLALNKKVTPNMVRSNNDHVLVVDGNTKATGSNDTWIVSNNSSMTIDLGNKNTINQIKVYEYNYYKVERIYGCTIECSTNGIDWTIVADIGADEKICTEKIASDHFLGTITFESIETQFVRILFKNLVNEKDSTKSAFGYVAEIEIRHDPKATPTVTKPVANKNDTAQNYENIALNREVFTDLAFSTPDCAIEHAFDGNQNTSLKVKGALGQTKGHIVVDLGADANFNKIVVSDIYNRIKEYKLSVSSDGRAWREISSGATTGFDKVFPFDTVLARYIDFEITKTEPGVVISEFQVFNTSDSTTYPNGAVTKPVIEDITAPKVVDKVPFEKENFHIYLFIGQSNMCGRDVIPFEERGTIDRTYLFNGEGNWETAQPYYHSDTPFNYKYLYGLNRYSTVVDHSREQIDGLNPASSFARAMAKSIPDNIGIGIVSNARGGTGIAHWKKNSGYEYDLYGEAVRRAKLAIESGGTLKGIFWLQGEGDGNTVDYLERLNEIATGIRSELGVSEENVPFIVSQHPPHYYFTSERFENVSDYIKNSDWISNAGTSTIDDVHFTSESAHLLGIRFAVKTLEKNYNIKTDEKQLNFEVYGNDIDDYVASVGDSKYRILINSVPLVTDVEPILMNDRLLVPLRAIFERLNASVEWDGTTQTVTATKDDKVIQLTIGNNAIIINGVSTALDVEAQLIHNRTMVPLRAVAESFGAKVDWVGDINTATISTR